MGRLFGKEYHEHSNSWFFRSSVIIYHEDDLSYRKFLNEKGQVVFKFEANTLNERQFPVNIEIVYDREKQEIIKHICSEDGSDNCRHYLSILHYAYKYLSTDILELNVIQTYQTNMLEYNEYWQRVVQNAKIEISDIFNPKNDKIRFYLSSYSPVNIRLISILAASREINDEDNSDLKQSRKQMKALSADEIELLAQLQIHKCSYSRKGQFFTIYKHNFNQFFILLRSLQKKIYIMETGDRIYFPDDEFRINFQVNRVSSDSFKFKISSSEQISAAFVGNTSYFFRRNQVYPLKLPFESKVAEQILTDGYPINKEDLVYLASIVARQLGLLKCYIDFDEDIEIPNVHHNTPIITYQLHRENNAIYMKGILDYGNNFTVPMSLLRLPAELVRYDQNGDINWFYIPAQVKYQVFSFVDKLPEHHLDRMEKDSQLVFTGENNIEALKKTIFENSDPAWNIILSEDLKQEFIYRVNLTPVIRASSREEINWFEYNVKYEYKDISFSHSELKKFFQSGEKFLKVKDGRLFFIEDRKAFQKLDEVLKKSEKLGSESYKLSIYNLPYVYQLQNIDEGVRIYGDEYLESMFTAILQRKLNRERPLPKFLQPIMRSYQKAGFHWLKMLEYYGFGGILADEMGLGKTIQAISILSDLPPDSLSLVICPKTLLFNWAAEIDKFNKNLTYIIYEGNQKERKSILENLNVNVLLASYSIILNDFKELQEFEFNYIILDEAQHIKNTTAQRTKAVKRLQSRNRMSLSGTPVENNITELWSIFDFLMPGYLPSLKKFREEFVNGDQVSDAVQDKLKSMVSPFILRRKKDEVLIELPDKQEQIAYCKMTTIQEKLYLQILDRVKADIMLDPDNLSRNYIHVLAALTRLRQICNHPSLIDSGVKTDCELSGKVELLREIIQEAVEGGKKIIIFSQFVQMLKLLKSVITDLKLAYEYLDGSVKDRQGRIDNFNNNNKIRIFLISIKTGGFGINLTSADTVIIVDPWWNPMGENQAIDRAHRIGQTKKVMVYKMITKNTIEEKILQLQYNKREMFDNLIENGRNILKNLDHNQLKELLEYQ
ncbi:MAG: ATP-dependent helicase [Candidatus Cloacimonetes bacterium]|nr:ATP-dependent helicase [Candidatus Cloacimonadota bacterium]